MNGKTNETPTLKEMIASFDPSRHGGEAMADKPVGVEAIDLDAPPEPLKPTQ